MKSLIRCAGKHSKKTGRVALGFSTVAVGLVLLSIVLMLTGCSPYASVGETSSERALRHKRVFRLNQGEFYNDIDRLLQLDRHNGLGEDRLP